MTAAPWQGPLPSTLPHREKAPPADMQGPTCLGPTDLRDFPSGRPHAKGGFLPISALRSLRWVPSSRKPSGAPP